MRNRTPVPRSERPPVPDFTPVPRKYRHDGWTPERQKAFIEALADCGSVSRAARQVNIAQANCYALRRAPGAEEFRRAWDAALDFGVLRLKDIAFERALEGQLTPVFKDGKLMGFQRKWNDALLMFCLRHYGQDGEGRRTTINYFSTRASAGAAAGEGGAAQAEASATTVRTVVSGGKRRGRPEAGDAAAAVLDGFAGVQLDAQAQAAILAALEDNAARRRAGNPYYTPGAGGIADQADDPAETFVRLGPNDIPFHGALESGIGREDGVRFDPAEPGWELAGMEMPDMDEAPHRDGSPHRDGPPDTAERTARSS